MAGLLYHFRLFKRGRSRSLYSSSCMLYLVQGYLMYGSYKQLGSSMASYKYVTTGLSLHCVSRLEDIFYARVFNRKGQLLRLFTF